MIFYDVEKEAVVETEAKDLNSFVLEKTLAKEYSPERFTLNSIPISGAIKVTLNNDLGKSGSLVSINFLNLNTSNDLARKGLLVFAKKNIAIPQAVESKGKRMFVDQGKAIISLKFVPRKTIDGILYIIPALASRDEDGVFRGNTALLFGNVVLEQAKENYGLFSASANHEELDMSDIHFEVEILDGSGSFSLV